MGNECCCRKDREEYRSIQERRKVSQGDVVVIDFTGLSNAITLYELADDFIGFYLNALQVIKRKRKHSNVRLTCTRKRDMKQIAVNVRYSSKGKFRIEISFNSDSEDEDFELSGIEYVRFFSKETVKFR